MIQVKTFQNKLDWKHLKTITTSEQINEFIKNNKIKVIDVKPWNLSWVCLTYELVGESE